MVLGFILSTAGSFIASAIMPEQNVVAVAGVGMVIGTALEYIFCPAAVILDGAVAVGSSVAIAQGGKLVGIKSAQSVAKNVVQQAVIRNGVIQVGKSLLTVEGGKLIGIKVAEKAGTALLKNVVTNTTGSVVAANLGRIKNRS